MGDDSVEELVVGQAVDAGVVVKLMTDSLLIAIPLGEDCGSELNSFTTFNPSSSSVSWTSCFASWDALPKLPDFLAKYIRKTVGINE